jgi:alpha-glucosidase
MSQVRRSGGVTALDIDVNVGRMSSGKRVTSVMLTSGRGRNAGIHGLGEQFRPFDLSGQIMPILVQEQGVTRGQEPAAAVVDFATWGAGNLNTSYAPWPTYVTDQKRSFELVDDLRSGAFSVADMRRPKQISLESFQPGMTARVVAAGSPKKLMAARGAGWQRPDLAGWIQKGAVLGLQGGTSFVRDVVADMQKAGTKISGVWLQDWVGKRVTDFGEQLWWTWQLNRKRYPQWNKMVRDFRKQGIRTMTYINPFVIDVDEVDGQPVKNYWKIGERKGYLVKNQLGKTYEVQTVGFPTAMVDLTNPKARDWFADIVADNVLGVGASGFMADFGEYLPFDSVVHTGTAMQQHNRYPQLWAETVREGCKRGGVPDCVAFFRAGYTGSPKSAPLMWAGDQMVNYAEEDGLANAIKGMLAGGVSGAPLWHSDVGGYTSVNTGVENFLRPPDLNARWGEMQAFGPVMRSHETNRPRLNQQIYDTPTTREQFAKSSRIYAALHDYRAGVIDEAVTRGIPAMRHTWLVYPGTRAAETDTQFFLGDHLFTAPVLRENATSVEVTFPPGRWRHILTGKVYSGDLVAQVAAPIGTPAAFVKEGDPVGRSIIKAMKKAGLYQP